MFVYIIVNQVNGKYYVGKTHTSNLQHYWNKQKWNVNHPKWKLSKPHLYNAVRKHGWSNFSIHPLITDCKNERELSHWERVLIKALGARKYGYNICEGGEGRTGPQTPETRAKISATKKQRGQTTRQMEVWKTLLLTHHNNGLPKGYKHSKETIEKVSASLKGRTAPNRVEMTGQTLNGIAVLNRAESSKSGKARWNCQCHCGNFFIASGDNLRSGNTKGCGWGRCEKTRYTCTG